MASGSHPSWLIQGLHSLLLLSPLHQPCLPVKGLGHKQSHSAQASSSNPSLCSCYSPPPPPPPLTHVTGWGSGPGILSRSQGGDQPRSLPARNSPILAALTNALLGKGQQSDLGSLDQKLRFVSLASPCGVTIPTKVKFNPPEAFCWKTENSQPNAVPLLRSVPSLCGLVLLSELLLLPLWTL
jgi:hypothetical protein